MFKARITKWGYFKYNRADDIESALRMKEQRDSMGKMTQFERSGRVLRFQDIQTYKKRREAYKRKRNLTEQDFTDQFQNTRLVLRTPSPSPSPAFMRSPDFIKYQEDMLGSHCVLFRLAKGHFHNSEDEALVYDNLVRPMASLRAVSGLIAAQNALDAGDIELAGVLFRGIGSYFELLLHSQSFLWLPLLMRGLAHVKDPNFVRKLLKHLRELSDVILREDHPLNRFISAIFDMVRQVELGYLLPFLLQRIAEQAASEFGSLSILAFDTWRQWLSCCPGASRNSHEAHRLLETCQRPVHDAEERCSDNDIRTLELWGSYSELTFMIRGRDHLETQCAAETFLRRIHSYETQAPTIPGSAKAKIVSILYYSAYFRLAMIDMAICTGKHDMQHGRARSYLENAITWNVNAYGTSHGKLLLLQELEHLCREAGDVGRANEVHREIENCAGTIAEIEDG
jgi:hypothetical protein